MARFVCTLLVTYFLSNAYLFGIGAREHRFDPDGGEKLRVVASTTIVGDVVANIGGDAILLTVLVGVGQDPHSFEPTPATLAAIESAHLVFVNGFGLEESLLEAIDNAARGEVLSVSRGIEPLGEAGEEGHDDDRSPHGHVDPHVWFDPTNVFVWIDNIEDALIHADPRHRDIFEYRAGAYRQQIRELDESIRRRVVLLGDHERKLVTDHGLLGYFADEYGFDIIGTVLPGTSTSADASTRHISDLLRLLRKEKVPAIFVGSTAGQGMEKLASSLAGELEREVRIVGLLTGSLNPPGEPGDTYISYMEFNIDRVLGALTQ
ncbi:MAG: zinc ABC transporter substrate-binding protein [Spirochaetales bacterium]|nr:zinc ABC transporter substrate-binding protein [Spirochaetales bacterium]